MLKKKIILSLVGLLSLSAAVSIPTALVLYSHKYNSEIKNQTQLLDKFSSQIGLISDSSKINSYIGSYNSNDSNNTSAGLNLIVDGIKKHLGSNISINSVTTSYSEPIEGKVGINLSLQYTDSNALPDQQQKTINKQIKTNIDAIQFQDANFITQIQGLDNQNVSNVLNNLNQEIVDMNVGISNQDQLNPIDITANQQASSAPSTLSATVTTNSFTPYTLSFAFKSSNSALFYTPTTQSSKTNGSANPTPDYSSSHDVMNVRVLEQINMTSQNLTVIESNFNNLNDIYALFDKNTGQIDNDKVIDVLCQNESGLAKVIIDNVSVSNTTHSLTTFNIQGMTITVTFKYPYYVNWNTNSPNASVKTIKDVSSGKCVSTITLSDLTTGVFDLSNAAQLFTFQDTDKTIITGLSNIGQSHAQINDSIFYLPTNVTQIANNAFVNNKLITNNIKLLDMSTAVNLNSFGQGAFNGATKIKNIIVPPSVETFGKYGFQGWNTNQSIFIQKSYGDIFSLVFYAQNQPKVYVVDQQTANFINKQQPSLHPTVDPRIADTNYILNNKVNINTSKNN